MKKVPFYNPGPGYRSIGGVMIAPKETRPVDARLVPGEASKPAKRPKKDHSDPVLALLDNRIDVIVPQLPTLTNEAFDKVQQAERDGNKTRNTLLKHFDEEFARRAALAEDLGVEYDEFLAEQLSASDEDLAEALKAETEGENRERVVDAYQAEIERRKAAAETPDED
jgi:hypothetical protein